MTIENESNEIVYIVDDDPAMRKTLKLVVSKNLEVETVDFECFEGFVSAFCSNRPSVLILDYQMPKITGLEFHKKLIERGVRIPVILLSGFANVELTVEAMENGVVAVLEKPFNTEKLLNRIRKTLTISKNFIKRQQSEANAKEIISRLSGSELAVLKEMIKGHLNKQIATNLDVSLRTIERRRNQIFMKTESHSLPELADYVKISGV